MYVIDFIDCYVMLGNPLLFSLLDFALRFGIKYFQIDVKL